MRNFGVIATSRLNRNLRLDKHWSYGTRGGLTTARGQQPFVVIAPVQTELFSAARSALHGEL